MLLRRPSVLFVVLVTTAATSGAQTLYQGPQVEQPLHVAHGVPDAGSFEGLELGDPDGDGVLDALALRGSKPFLMTDPGAFHAAHPLGGTASGVCMSHSVGDDLMILARPSGLEAVDVVVDGGNLFFPSFTIQGGSWDGVGEVAGGIAAWRGSSATLFSRAGSAFLTQATYTATGAVEDVTVGDFDPTPGEEVAVLAGGSVTVFEAGTGTVLWSLTTGGIDSFLHTLEGSASGLDLLLFKALQGNYEVLEMVNSAQACHPVDVSGLGVESILVYDYFGDGDALVAIASETDQVFIFHRNPPIVASNTGLEIVYHPDPDRTYRIDLPYSDCTEQLVAAHGDLDRDGDDDLLLFADDASHLRLIPGELTVAEDLRVQLATLEVAQPIELVGSHQVSIDLEPIGLDGTPGGVVLPVGATHVEVSLWAAEDLESAMDIPLGVATLAYETGETASGRRLQHSFPFPIGTVPTTTTIYHLRVRAVERVGGVVSKVWPSRAQVATFDPVAAQHFAEWELPMGWSDLLPYLPPPESEGTTAKRVGGGGAVPPGSTGQ